MLFLPSALHYSEQYCHSLCNLHLFPYLFIYLVQSAAQLQTLQGKGTKTHIYGNRHCQSVCEAGCKKKQCFVFMKSGSSVSKPDWWEDKGVRGAAGIIAICIEYQTVV